LIEPGEFVPSSLTAGFEESALSLPVASAGQVRADLAEALAPSWFAALAVWAADGRDMRHGVSARLDENQVAEVTALIGNVSESDDDLSAALADAVVRWAIQARLLRLYAGVLRTSRQNLGWLDDSGVLWFRALCALERPDNVFTEVVAQYTGDSRIPYDLVWSLSEFVARFAQEGPLDARGLLADPEPGRDRAGRTPHIAEIRTLLWLAESLRLITPVGRPVARWTGPWSITALGRIFDTLRRLPFETVEGEDTGEIDGMSCLVGQPEGVVEPGYIMKVDLKGLRVWRRLRVPGELTLAGLHGAIQIAFGWDGDHLHTFTAGPWRFADPFHGLDDTIPEDLVTLTDLATIGVRALKYRYDLGGCWDHEITLEKAMPPDPALQATCIGGAGATPAEEGGDWIEDEDGNAVHNPVPDPGRVFDPERINRDLAALTEDPNESEA
jgi:hypothetical protein